MRARGAVAVAVVGFAVRLSEGVVGAAGYMEGYIGIMIEAFISGGEPFLFRF